MQASNVVDSSLGVVESTLTFIQPIQHLVVLVDFWIHCRGIWTTGELMEFPKNSHFQPRLRDSPHGSLQI